MIHMHKRHPEMTDTDFSVIQENMENFLRVHQNKTEKGDYGGETVLCKIKTSRGITGVSYEVLLTGRIFLKTAFFDHENGIDSWIVKNGTSRDLMDSGITKRGNAASMLTGHTSQTDKTADSPTLSDIQPLSLSMIQEWIGIVNGASFDQSAWHGTSHDLDAFDLGAIGTGEGAQVHGWGLYFAQDRAVSEGYKERASEALARVIPLWETDTKRRMTVGWSSITMEIRLAFWIIQIHLRELWTQSTIRLFEVEIPENDMLLDEQKTLEEQPKIVKLLDKYLEVQEVPRTYLSDIQGHGRQGFARGGSRHGTHDRRGAGGRKCTERKCIFTIC